MTVYIDDMRDVARVSRIMAAWSHLLADSKQELHTFAGRIGLKPEWFQERCKGPGSCPPDVECPHYHYDVTDSVRQKAIRAGAVQITWPYGTAEHIAKLSAEIRAREAEKCQCHAEQAGDES